MGWSFRRSKSFGPFRFNFSKSGIGFSFGAPGARIGVDAKGKKYFRGGIPGTGLYYRSTIRDGQQTQAGQSPQRASSASPLGILILLFVAGLIIYGMFSSSQTTTSAPIVPARTVAPIAAPVTPKPVVRKHKRKPAVHHTAAVPKKPDELPAAEQVIPDLKPPDDSK